MAVFVAGADESSGKGSPFFYWCGFLGPERYWSESFAPAWEAEVLSNPHIPHLHQKDIRNGHWRKEHGLSDQDLNRKLDAAWRLAGEADPLFPIAVRIDKEHFRQALSGRLIRTNPSVAPYRMEPDYYCFICFAQLCVERAHRHHPDCEKVDFIVERNQNITSHVREFHDTLKESFIDIGKPHLAPLVGDFIPAGKERVPLQAADMLSWHENRRDANGLNYKDRARFKAVSKKAGARFSVKREWIEALRDRLLQKLNEPSAPV